MAVEASAVERSDYERYPPDGLLTFGKHKHDVAPELIIASDLLASDDCFSIIPDDLFRLTTIVEPDTMNTGGAEPSSGLNGRLRPRKFNLTSPNTSKTIRKPDTKQALDKLKRTSAPSKATPNKPDDLTDKADPPATQTLCPYCDKTYFTKQAQSNHVRRVHLSTLKQDNVLGCLFCNHVEPDAHEIIRHMIDSHPNQYFACYDCHTRFPSTSELAEHKHNVCEKQKLPYRNKLRQKVTSKKNQINSNITGKSDFDHDVKDYPEEHGFNGIVISCELKSSHVHDLADIEDNITTNFILPPGKNLVNGAVVEKNAVILLDDLQWSKRGPPNFTFQTTDADQILSRLGVVHRSPRTGESHGREWLKNNDDSHQKFEKCFDTSFYSKVASNVQENLTKFLDGSFNFNPDPENTIKTRKSKNIVAINTVEGFPILLACEQFSRNGFDAYMPRAIAPKHKWKWDNLENDKNLMSPEQIKRDSHTNNCIISLVSSLDIWTQLCMRRKFESRFNKSPAQKKTEKQSIIGKELKEILESRELPPSTSQIVKYTGPPVPGRSLAEFPASLGLVPTAPSFDLKPAVLSGEWVRPRCYVCCACGAQTRDSKDLSSHISTQHPNAQIQHYEIVGEVLLNSDILKHLYVPPSQLNNRSRPLRGIRECTKCKKSISLEDLHQHMLDCAGDTPTVRRKCRYRPFGVRKRRPRLPDNTIRKKIRKDIRTRHSRKNHMRPRQRIRTEVGDAETIRKMLADLPAKRHRVLVKPLNPSIRPRRNLRNTRNKLIIKKRSPEDTKNSQRERERANAGAEGSKKIPRDSDDRPIGRTFKTTAKRVVSKIIRTNEFHKNNMNRSKRKIVRQKIAQASSEEIQPKQSETKSFQIEKLSIENNQERINMNDGSHNSREHGSRSNNNSNNRDNQNPDANYGQNSNSRGSYAPSHNIPLKHSIASLTASSETHDKSVQFHHLFLVQQECNDVNQHLPSGQRMLFENEAIVTKLDKPPLHFNYRRLDLQAYQKSKLNKPRKGLNDCIAMLKNKLVEPSSSILSGDVSVQCGEDEPIDPEPNIIERRHSTAELGADYMHRSDYVQAYNAYTKKAAEENVQSSSNKSRVTRRSSSTRHGQSSRNNKANEILSNEELMQWRQYYYDSQMLQAQKINENYARRESSRRRNSLMPSDEFLLQHAINLELLSKNKELTKFTEYHPYSRITSNQNTPKRNNSRGSQRNKGSTHVQSTRSKTKDTVATRGKNIAELMSNQPNKQNRQSNRSKSVIKSASSKRSNDRNYPKSNQLCSTVTSNKEIDSPNAVEVDTSVSLIIEKTLSPVSRSSDEQRPQTVTRNMPAVEYINNNEVHAACYTTHNEVAPSGPLDLSNQFKNKGAVPYIPQEQTPVEMYATYETLDLSNKNLETMDVRDPQINSDDIVDLRINYTHATFQPRYTSLPSQLVNNEEENSATDLTVRRNEDIPTDLSINRMSYNTPTSSYSKAAEGNSSLPVNYIRDYNNPMRHDEDRCIILHEYFDEASERIVLVENEVPADYSNRRSVSRSNMCIIEEPMHLSSYTNTIEPNEEIVPADLSGNRSFMASSSAIVNSTGCNYDTYHPQQVPHCQEHIIDYRMDRQTPSKSSLAGSNNRRFYESAEHFEPTLNATVTPQEVTQNLSTSDTSRSKSKTLERVDYTYSEMPLSLVSNSSNESISCPSQNQTLKQIKYQEPQTIGNDSISVVRTEPAYAYVTINSIVDTQSVDKSIETTTEATNSNESIGIQSSETNNPLSSSGEKSLESKQLQISKTLTSSDNVTTELDKRKNETVNISNNNTRSDQDQDPETARKIAMLPKELVEILGTMPVDHRNQLLNVLPQYVSTSTPPVSNSNVTEDAGYNSKSSGSTKPVNKTPKEFKFDVNTEDVRVNNIVPSSSKSLKFSESSPISVSSSILLTPPTPHLSERYSHHSQEISDMFNTRTLRESTEELAPSSNIDSTKTNICSNLSLSNKLTSSMENNDSDRVIDLTIDENSLEKIEIVNLEPVIHSSMVTTPSMDIVSTSVIAKSNLQKTSSDKTASLRAVRIKTPSERHRSMAPDKTLDSQQNKMTLTVDVQDGTFKESEYVSPKAIQQAEVSSTQYRSILRTSQTSIPTEKQQIVEDKFMEKKDTGLVPIITNESNLAVCAVSKDLKSNINNDHAVCNVDSTKTSVEIINDTILIEPHNEFAINDKTHAHETSTKEIDVIQKQSSINTLNDSSSSKKLEDEDSDDDISLALIIKQKQKKLHVASNAPHATKEDVKCKVSGNKKKRKVKKVNKAKIIGFDKSFSEDEHSKSTSKDIASEISLINTERVCNESISLDKISHAQRNARKVRQSNNIQTVKHLDVSDKTTDNNAYENEINKENNDTSDVLKNSESPEELFKLKTNDQEPNFSSSANTIANSDTNDKDYLIKKDKNKMLVTNLECSPPTNEITGISNVSDTDTGKVVVQNHLKIKLPQTFSNTTFIEKSLVNPQASIENKIVLSTADVTKTSNEIIECRSDHIKIDASSKTDKSISNVTNSEKLIKSKKNIIEFCPTTNINSELQDTNITPLRRSRRGKSLFIDSISTVAVTPVTREIHEQRAPLTKKQLIFSKLLLDEEQNNKTSFNTTPRLDDENDRELVNRTLEKVAIPNIEPKLVEENDGGRSLTPNLNRDKKSAPSSSVEKDDLEPLLKTSTEHDNSISDLEPYSAKTTTGTRNKTLNKRKVSLQCKRKLKKKKPLSNQNKFEDIKEMLNRKVDSENEVKQSIVKNIEILSNDNDMVSETLSKNDKMNVKNDTIDLNVESALSTNFDDSSSKPLALEQSLPSTLDSSCTSSKLLTTEQHIHSNLNYNSNNAKSFLIEKRKSCSPIRYDSLLSPKSKKFKLNDVNERAVVATVSPKSENEKKVKLNDDIESTIVATDIPEVAKGKKEKLIDENESIIAATASPDVEQGKRLRKNDENECIVVATNSPDVEKRNTVELKGVDNPITTSKNITCYNKPARRARSKSVVEKSSSADFYDPYDIDLEDMIDKTERKELSSKMSFSTFKSSIAAKTRKLSKTATAIIEINNDALVHNDHKVIQCNSNVNIVHKDPILETKYISSDSDDSSKSDVPLKQYAVEKEKKLAEIALSMSRNKKSDANIYDTKERSKSRKKNNRSISKNKKEDRVAHSKIDTEIDSEKDLRSEQFMESFGFFSERKPRKSNLLASKKISETFHIIANDSDDLYSTARDRGGKKGSTDSRKEEKHIRGSAVPSTKKAAKRGRKKKSTTPDQHEPRFCTVCKKAFRRSDNFLRHQMTLYHVSRLCEVELKVKAVIIEEEPNYLIAYRQQLERLKLLQDKIAKRKKHSLPTSDIVLPTLEEIVADVKRTIREQKLSRRKLSRDEALFVDCCEMLKQSHKDIIPENKRVRQCNSFNCPQTSDDRLAVLEKRLDDRCEIKSDEDMDDITAKSILESDEVRNLEYDLISNLKEGHGLKGFARLRIQSANELAGAVSDAQATTSTHQNNFNFEAIEDPVATKPKSNPEVKDKMYPDLCDNIDIFEDKFDKIKRKCRSQAAAAKQIQAHVDSTLSYKNRKKSDRKKGRKSCKKSQNAVPTKGALKGFDGIKVSISTSDINMSAIVSPVGSSFKKKKKNNSKRKRERKSSDLSSKSDSDHVTKDTSQRKVDVYEFLDTEDAELFEFRPSTLMERFKSISNKEMPSTSKAHANEVVHSSSESISDGDDFVYMDDLLFSEDETENSVLSCEIASGKGNNEIKKASPLKRKDVIEKNAVMGKIFKNNALRHDKKNTKNYAKPKANLDQLFDSLLESEPKEQSKVEESPKGLSPPANLYCSLSPIRRDTAQSRRDELPPVVLSRKPEPSMSVTPFEELISQRNAHRYESLKEHTQPTQTAKFNTPFSKYRDISENDDCKSKYHDSREDFGDSPKRNDFYSFTKHKSKKEKHHDKSRKKSVEERWPNTFRAESPPEEESLEDGGVARQRARRKCTVGKQNVLAETWSSESEGDAVPPRPTSAESVLASHVRRKKPRRVRKPEVRGPSARTRPPALCWPADADAEPEPEHPQQHGWIVGDSHKKLVTMLAHAKGRKRSHDERRPLLE